MYRRWPPPSYETEQEMGLPHQRQFTIACVVLTNREIGQGKSKKIAKRLAAHKMWKRLQENPLDQSQITAHLEENTTNDEVCYFELYHIARAFYKNTQKDLKLND